MPCRSSSLSLALRSGHGMDALFCNLDRACHHMRL
jgi:hypothetical protein